MDNLSGGEKTVAALALLFAIHRYGCAPPGQLVETVLRPLEALGSKDMQSYAEVKMIWWTLD